MSQSEISGSAEATDGDCIDAWPWVESRQGEKGAKYGGGGVVRLAPSQVSWAYALPGCRQVLLHTVSNGKYVTRGKIDSLDQRWAEHGFARIHKWHLVCWSHVQDLDHPPSAWEISLSSGAGTRYLPVGVGYRRKIARKWAEHLDRVRDHRRRLFSQ